MIENLLLFLFSLFLVVKGATLSTKYAARIAEGFHLSKYTVGFIVIAIISILPETFISLNAALNGMPEFGLSTLFGSNVADLTLVVALIILFARRSIVVESKILKNNKLYPFLLLLPLILGLDGEFSRLDGAALIIAGIVFYYRSFKSGSGGSSEPHSTSHDWRNIPWLLFSVALLLVGSHFTVESATVLAHSIGVSPTLIGMLVVGLGTTMPELFFSLKSVRRHNDSLAEGDILGTVLADATVVVGILALVSPFSFPVRIIYITGMFMVAAAFILFRFMRSGQMVSRRESYLLIMFWLVFVIFEFIANQLAFSGIL